MPNDPLRTGLPPAGEMRRHAASASELLKALANPHRLQILCVLGDGEMSVGTLNEHVELSQSALSQHLALLRKDGLVATRRESQTIYYRTMPGAATAVIRVLYDHYCSGVGSVRERRGKVR